MCWLNLDEALAVPSYPVREEQLQPSLRDRQRRQEADRRQVCKHDGQQVRGQEQDLTPPPNNNRERWRAAVLIASTVTNSRIPQRSQSEGRKAGGRG